MAKFETNGLAELSLTLEEMEALSPELAGEMLQAGAEVVKRKQQERARAELVGPYATGETAEKIIIGKPKRTKDGYAIHIYPDGTRRRGQRAAEVAFINEFGKRGQPARPFLRTANELAAEEATDRQAEIYDQKVLSKKG